MKVVALIGISGAGKSYLLARVGAEIAFRHLQASDLIKSGRLLIEQEVATSEDLRKGNIADNQEMLQLGFEAATTGYDDLVVLDAHVVIDTDQGLIEIQPEVFEGLSVSHMVFLKVPAETILDRRSNDSERKRPNRTKLELDRQQETAVSVATQIAAKIQSEFSVIHSDPERELLDILRSVTQSGV